MLSRYVVGLVLAAVCVNLAMMVFSVVQTAISLAWRKMHPDPFRAFRPQGNDGAGWIQLVSNSLLAATAAVYTMSFVALAEVESAGVCYALGFVALMAAQASNINTKAQQAMKRSDISRAAASAIPWAVIGAPAGWVVYVLMSLVLSYGNWSLGDRVGGALTGVALTIGDWFLVRLAAIGVLLLLSLNILTFVPVLFLGIGRLLRRKAA